MDTVVFFQLGPVQLSTRPPGQGKADTGTSLEAHRSGPEKDTSEVAYFYLPCTFSPQ